MAKKSKEGNIDLFYIDVNKKENKKDKRAEKKSAPKKKQKEKKQKKVETDTSDEIFKFNSEFVLGITDKDKEILEKAKKIAKSKKEEKNDKTTKTSREKKSKNKKIMDEFESENKTSKRTGSLETKKSNKANTKVENKNKKTKKSKKRLKILLKFIKWTILIGIIIATIIFIMSSPMFNLKEITVTGNELINTEEIISLSELKIEDNIFNNTKNKLKSKIKQNAYIENVEIKRVLPNKIEISITERKPEYTIQLATGYAYLDKQGYILEISENKLELPLLLGIQTPQEQILAGNRLITEDLQELNMVLKIFSSASDIGIRDIISGISFENDNEYTVYIESKKKTIYLGDASNLTNKMLYVQAILQAEEGNEGEIFLNGNLNNGFEPYFREKV